MRRDMESTEIHAPTSSEEPAPGESAMEAFHRQFQMLNAGKTCYELVGKLHHRVEAASDKATTVFVYGGNDWKEAFAESVKRNCAKYSIYFTPKDTRGCVDAEWIGISASTDRAGGNAGRIVEHAMALNLKEFGGTAGVLDDGERFWFLLRVGRIGNHGPDDALRVKKNVRGFLTRLGVKWNLTEADSLAFHIDDVDFFPGADLPAAGMLNFEARPACRVNWVVDCGNSPRPDILKRILETKDPVMEVMERISLPENLRGEKDLLPLDFDPNFTAESLERLLKKDSIARKLLTDEILYRPGCDFNENAVRKILFLCAHFRAGPGVTGPCVNRMGTVSALGARHDFGPIALERMGRAAREVAISIRSGGEAGAGLSTPIERRTFSGQAFPGRGPVLDSRLAETELSKRFGHVRIINQNGWYVFSCGDAPNEIITIKDSMGRTRSYVPFHCSLWMAADEAMDCTGALLVPHAKADGFIEDAGRISAKGVLVVAYVWYFGLRYRMFGIPATELGDGPARIVSLENFGWDHHPEIMRLKRAHLIDRSRKGGYV